MLSKITKALFFLIFLSFGISQYAAAQESIVKSTPIWPLGQSQHPLWTDFVNDLKSSLPALHNMGTGMGFSGAIIKSPEGYGFIVHGNTNLSFIGVNNPTFESYYFTLPGIDTSQPKYKYVNYAPGSFRIAGVIVEITNAYLPDYSKRVQITFVDQWENNGKDKRVFAQIFDSEANLEAKRKEVNKNKPAFDSAFRVRLIQKGYLEDFVLKSKIIEFVTNLATSSKSDPNLNALSNQNSPASATPPATTTTTATYTNTNSAAAQAARQQEADRNAAYRQQQQQRDREAARRAEWERAEAERRREVEARNNALVQQGNAIYEQSFRTENAIDAAAEKLKALFNTPTKSAAQMQAEAEAEAAEDARWEREQRRIEREEERREQEWRREQEEKRRIAEEKRRIAAEKAQLESDRRNIFAQYLGGALPTSATFTKSNNLFYFVYGYGRLDDYNSEIYISNIFAIGKYPDETWPLSTTVQQEVDNLTGYTEVIHGSFTSDREAQTALLKFKDALLTTGMEIKNIFYAGKNAHAFTIIDEGPMLDAWGSPVKTDSTQTGAGQKKIKLDAWGNPIKGTGQKQGADSTQVKEKVKLDAWGNPIKEKGDN